MTQRLSSKTSFSEFTLATCKLKRMEAFATIESKIWDMNLTNVDKLAKEKNVVKFLLVCQDLLDRTEHGEKDGKQRLPEKVFRAFLFSSRRKIRAKKLGQQRYRSRRTFCKTLPY